ncbi:CotH kinase family protein [Streptomyces sp. XM4011]|uniref:CotH kinase family protein n=1 Tax=Streptomyces sp. XM4011 TaxID=2929780 RepID=UPI001FF7D9C0|nr:CotH kinase family protein [Streptomyces sp. XM4011]MCK1814470.1 CotH kinase family protein [Streptomyces sp. XM4011]
MTGDGGQARLVHRLPVPLRQHWKPVAALAVTLALLLVYFGDTRVSALVTSASDGDGEQITQNIAGITDLYDSAAEHTVSLEYDEADYQRLITAFQEDGDKEWMEADLTIDGTFIESVGVRLKGNSTLSSLGGEGMGVSGLRIVGPDGEELDPADIVLPEEGVAAGGGMNMIELSPDEPENLPWLIKIDQYIEGRAYQGHTEISVRPGTDESLALNEALMLSLMDDSGQVAERYAFSTFTVNNRPAATRLLVENPSTGYATEQIDGNGVLYKARASSSFAYVGDDPTDYQDQFKQITKKGSQDLQPLINLIKWAEEASDEEFAAGLGDRVDLDSFAAYVATQNLLMNFDDMSGPGQNYLLWYDLDTKKFSVLGWDFNLSLSGDATAGPHDQASMGGFARGTLPEGVEIPDGALPEDGAFPEGAFPEDGEFPDGVEIPEGAFPDGAFPDGGGPGGGGRMPPGGDRSGGEDGGPRFVGPDGEEIAPGGDGEMRGMGGNILKERFLELDAFDDVYLDAYRDLYQQWFASGSALEALDAVLEAAGANGADPDALAATADQLRATLTERATALAADETVTG